MTIEQVMYTGMIQYGDGKATIRQYTISGKIKALNGKFECYGVTWDVKISSGYEGEATYEMYGKECFPILENTTIPISIRMASENKKHIPKVGDVVTTMDKLTYVLQALSSKDNLEY